MGITKMVEDHQQNATRIIKVRVAGRNNVPVVVTDPKMLVYLDERSALEDWAGDGWFENGTVELRCAELVILPKVKK